MKKHFSNGVILETTITWRAFDNAQPIHIKQHIVDVIIELYASSKKVPAIKFFRAETNLGLKDAKDICDAIWENAGAQVNRW